MTNISNNSTTAKPHTLHLSKIKKTSLASLQNATKKEWQTIKDTAIQEAQDSCQSIIKNLNDNHKIDSFKTTILNLVTNLQKEINTSGEIGHLNNCVGKLFLYTQDAGQIRHLLENIIIMAAHKGVGGGVANFKFLKATQTASICEFIKNIADLEKNAQSSSEGIQNNNKTVQSKLDRKADLELALVIYQHSITYTTPTQQFKDDAFFQFMQCFINCKHSGDEISYLQLGLITPEHKLDFDLLIKKVFDPTPVNQERTSPLASALLQASVKYRADFNADVAHGKKRRSYSTAVNNGASASKQVTSDKMEKLLGSDGSNFKAYAKKVLGILIEHKARQRDFACYQETLSFLEKAYNKSSFTYAEIDQIPTPEELLKWVSNTSSIVQKQLPKTFKEFLSKHLAIIGEVVTTTLPNVSDLEEAQYTQKFKHILKFLKANDINPTSKLGSKEKLELPHTFSKDQFTISFARRVDKYSKQQHNFKQDMTILVTAQEILANEDLTISAKIAKVKAYLGERLTQIIGYTGIHTNNGLLPLYLARVEILLKRIRGSNPGLNVDEFKSIKSPIGLENGFIKGLTNNCFINSALQFILNNPKLVESACKHKDSQFSEKFRKFVNNQESSVIHAELISFIRGKYEYPGCTQNSASALIGDIFNEDSTIHAKAITSPEALEEEKNVTVELERLYGCTNETEINNAIKSFSVTEVEGHKQQCAAYEELRNLVLHSEVLYQKYAVLFMQQNDKGEQEAKNYTEFKNSIAESTAGLLELIQAQNFQALVKSIFMFADTSGYAAAQNEYGNVTLATEEQKLKYDQIRDKDKLNAIIVHHGARINSGHYVSYIKRGEFWFLCNDANIRRIENIEQELIKVNAADGRITAFSYLASC